MTRDDTPRWRGIFANRTLNLRSIRAIGYDMDYTLIHYHVAEWERRAFAYAKQALLAQGWPLNGCEFDPRAIIRGLVIDRELGNVVKTNRFGYVKSASHGTRTLEFEEQRRLYSRTVVDLAEPRWHFLNTLFGLSAGALYMHLVDALDRGGAPGGGHGVGYPQLHDAVRQASDAAHLEGELKAEILADPDRFVDLDPDVPLALLDQRRAKKKVVLITNSAWLYTNAIMKYAMERYLPKGMGWRDLFDLIIVSSRKPSFFDSAPPAFEVLDDAGRLSPARALEEGKAYVGGHAELVEKALGLEGEQILYVGDHVYGDVKVSKSIRRWRTGLVLRELEEELDGLEAFEATQEALSERMAEKRALEAEQDQVRLELQRIRGKYGPPARRSAAKLDALATKIRERLTDLDEIIAPMARSSGELVNSRWGLVMRTGNDKSHMARHVERHADVYTSRVSNFLYATPFRYLRSARGSLPHDT